MRDKQTDIYVHKLPLDATGKHVIRQNGGYLHFWAAKSGAALALDAEIQVAPTTAPADNDFVPMRYGNKLVGLADGFTVKWDAQAGVEATLVYSESASVMEGDSTPPTQLVAGSGAGTLSAAAVTVGTSAAVVSAASATRQSVLIQNLGSVDIFVGPSGVTTSNGLKVAAGETLTLDDNVAAIYAISGTAGQNVRVLTE